MEKDYILYDSIHTTFQKGQSYKGKKHISVCQGLGEKSDCKWKFWGGNGNIYILNMVVVSRLQDYIHLLALIEQYTLK